MDEGQAGRLIGDGREILARMYLPTETWREGYYEGATEDGGRVLFLAPSKTNVVARFQVDLDLLTTSATEEDSPGGFGFEAKDVEISHGAFLHSSCEEGPLFALHGAFGPHGEARGRCIGVLNGWAWHGSEWGTDFHFGSSQWRRWEAAWKTTEDDVNAPSFVPWAH
jgi:hypothetical protein